MRYLLLLPLVVASLQCTSRAGTPPPADDPTADPGPELVSDLVVSDSSDLTLETTPDEVAELADAADDTEGDEPLPSLLPACVDRPFAAPDAEGFRHTASDLLVAMADPEHSAQDVIGLPGSVVTIPGKFAYGAFSKDLEDEDVSVFVDDCSAWRELGTLRTNGDGRTALPVDLGAQPLASGRYALRQLVRGDATVVEAELRVLPAGTHLIVMDIDGTLTTSDGELFQDAIDEFFLPIYEGEYVPEAYPGGAELTQLLAAKGYVLVYLTGRPYWLTRITREWLRSLGYAPAHLHLTDSNGEAMPTESGVGAYKLAYLRQLTALGYVIDYAYGNATTDLYAYLEAGLDPDSVYIIGDHGGERGTQALASSYTEHLDQAHSFPIPKQPF